MVAGSETRANEAMGTDEADLGDVVIVIEVDGGVIVDEVEGSTRIDELIEYCLSSSLGYALGITRPMTAETEPDVLMLTK